MTKKSIKKFTEILSRDKGVSLVAVIALMLIMTVMGAVFSSIMGRWKLSSPAIINSSRAFYLAETAAMFALRDAGNRFFSKDVNGVPNFPSLTTGTRDNPYVVSSSSTETAYYWIERPASPTSNPTIDLTRGDNDDDDSSSDDDKDDDDLDDSGNPSLYTIIATGRVLRNGATVAKRQIKIKATITDSTGVPLTPGVHTDGVIEGSGSPDANPPPPSNFFGITDGTDVVGYAAGTDILAESPADDETGLVTRSAPALDRDYFKAMAIAQGHYHSTSLVISNGNGNDDYPNLSPNGSFYYDYLAGTPSVPNITFIEGSSSDLTVNANMTGWGIYWVDGDFETSGNNSLIDGIVICVGDVTLNGQGKVSGGIVHYGTTITGNGDPATITINSDYFGGHDETLPIVNVISWEESVSAN